MSLMFRSNFLLSSGYSQVLYHYVLMGDETVHAVVPSLPPVLGGSVVQQEGGSLLEGQLSGSPSHVVKLGDGFDLFNL